MRTSTVISRLLRALLRALWAGLRTASSAPPAEARTSHRLPRLVATVEEIHEPDPGDVLRRRRLKDACDLVLAGTNVSLAASAGILARCERDERISDLLQGEDWSWPWFDRHLVLFRNMGLWPDRWPWVEEAAEPWAPSPEKLDEAIEQCSAGELRQAAERAGPIPSPMPKTRAAWTKLVRERCSLQVVLKVIEPRLHQLEVSRVTDLGKARAILLHRTIESVAASLAALDLARREDATRIAQGLKARVKLVARIEWERRRIFRRLTARFNRGDLVTLPPYFPGDATYVVPEAHWTEKLGRFVEEIPPSRPWIETALDFAVEPPKDELSEGEQAPRRPLSEEQRSRALRNRSVLERAISSDLTVGFVSRGLERLGLPIELREDDFVVVDVDAPDFGTRRVYKLHSVESLHVVPHEFSGGGRRLLEIAAEHRLPLDLRFVDREGRAQAKNSARVAALEASGLVRFVPPEASPEAIPMGRILTGCLNDSLRDGPEEPRSLALRALTLSGDRELQAIALEWAGTVDSAHEFELLDALSASDVEDTRRAVADSMRSRTRRVRRTVMGKSFTLLDHEQDPRVFAILVRLAADDDEETRVKAAYALGDHPGPASRQVLATLEQDAAEWVRKAATHAIGRLDSFVDDDVELQRRLEQKRARPPGGQQAAGQAPEPTSEGEGQC